MDERATMALPADYRARSGMNDGVPIRRGVMQIREIQDICKSLRRGRAAQKSGRL